MACIIDYIEWRGDIPFRYSPFNLVDNLILSQLAYVNLYNIVPRLGRDEEVSIEDACKMYFEIHDENKFDKNDVSSQAAFVMKKMAKSRRFKNIMISDYIDIVDETSEKQFSAVKIRLSDGTIYVAFRGTDDNIVGWKEDFNMSFMDCIPAQTEAVDYLNVVIEEDNKKKIRVGGHSKGGNLAIYASLYCRDSIKDKIINIYNNDGPGFNDNIINSDEYKEIENKITTIVPEGSVFGMLFNRRESYRVVKSSNTGIMQHDAISWQVIGTEFEYLKSLSKSAKVVDKSISNWVASINNDEREQFVNNLYKVIKEAGIRKASSITSSKIKSARKILKSYSSLDDKTKEMMMYIINALRIEYQKNFVGSIIKRITP